jgi:type I restriction enzyme S subunit
LTSKPFTAYLTQIAESHTSAYPAFNPDVIEKAELVLPSDSEQRSISHILGSLDDKIELNRQTNQTLEATARAIFKSWFVDFDPVRVKAEGGDPGLPDDIAALFPDSFEDSELGKIPTGWKAKPIGQAVKCVGGSTPSTKNPAFWDGGKNPFVTPKDMSSLTSPVILDTSRHITDAGVDKISSGRLPIGTVILSSRAPIGYLAITEVPASVNQGVIAMICNKDLPNHYVLHWTETNMETIKSNAGGTTFAEISKRNFRPIPVVVPQNLVLEAFVQQVEPLHKQVVLNLQESNSLASLRDTLLPKLISGELRVPAAEKFVEEAGL